MSLIFVDGFDHVDPTVWTNGQSLGNYRTTVPRTGTHHLHINANPMTYQDLTLAEEDDGVTVGFGVMLNANTDTFDVLRLYEAQGTTLHITLQCNGGSRGWKVLRGSTVIIDILPNVLFRGTWHYMELKVKIADSGGTVELRQDGATLASFTGDTKNAGTDGLIDRIQFVGPGAGAGFYIDDVYMLNEQGGGPDNTFLGDCRMFPLYPDGNGNYSQLLGSDGNSVNNYQQVDEAGAAVTTDYNASSTDGDKDTYTFQNLPVSVGTVHAVEIRMNAEKSDVGNKAMRTVTRRSSTDVFGADKVLSEDDAPYRQLYALDPVAAAAWTITNVNGSEFGAEVQDF